MWFRFLKGQNRVPAQYADSRAIFPLMAFGACVDFVEHGVERPEFFANIVGDHLTGDRVKRADALMIHCGQSGIPKNLGDVGDDEESVDLHCKFRME